MKNNLKNALRAIDATGGPAARLEIIAKQTKSMIGLTRAIDLQAIAAFIREMEPALKKAEEDAAELDLLHARGITGYDELSLDGDGSTELTEPLTEEQRELEARAHELDVSSRT